MKSPAEVLVKFLCDQGIAAYGDGGSGEWLITEFSMPQDLQDNWITVYNTTPMPDGRLMRSGERIVHFGWQVRIRGADDATAWTKGKEVETLLLRIGKPVARSGLGRVQVDFPDPVNESWLLHAVKITSDLLKIQEEELNRRMHYTINGTVTLSSIAM